MSDAFSPAITQPEDTSGAIEELKSRGMRIRDRGIRGRLRKRKKSYAKPALRPEPSGKA